VAPEDTLENLANALKVLEMAITPFFRESIENGAGTAAVAVGMPPLLSVLHTSRSGGSDVFKAMSRVQNMLSTVFSSCAGRGDTPVDAATDHSSGTASSPICL
jgi:hypothetical protein